MRNQESNFFIGVRKDYLLNFLKITPSARDATPARKTATITNQLPVEARLFADAAPTCVPGVGVAVGPGVGVSVGPAVGVTVGVIVGVGEFSGVGVGVHVRQE